MQKKYFVKMSYQIQVEASTDSEAISSAQFKSVYGEESVRHLEQRIVRVIEPIEVPKKAEAQNSGASFISELVSEALTPPKAAEVSDIPF